MATMTLFSGTAFGVPFANYEARSPSELSKQLFSQGEEQDMRCWVRMETGPRSYFWMEMPLVDKPAIFEKIRLFLDEEVIITFQEKSSRSPNTSPDTSPTKGGASGETAATLLASNSLDGSISEASGGRLELNVLNDVDPFTAKNIGNVADLLYLHFPLAGRCGVETLAVSQEGFENYVLHEQEAGTNICELELKHVQCKDKQRNFVVSPVVWIRSILELSRPLRHLYLKVTSSSLARQYQLKELKSELSDLWARVCYWIADLMSFSEAENRLNIPVADDVPPFMSPFYFDSNEASFLGQLMLPNTHSLGNTMRFMLEDKEADGALEVCTSHDLAPFLQEAFEVKHNFHKDPKFKKAKAQWVKKRKNAVGKGS